MTRYTVKFTPGNRAANGRKKWTYALGDLKCVIVHIQRGIYGIYSYEKFGCHYEIYGIEYTTNLRVAAAIARDFVTS